MGLYSKEKYSEQEVERLLDFLTLYQDRDEPITYEIIVDDFKVVRKTNDLSQFDSFKRFLKLSTKAVEFLFYMGASNNCDKYVLYLTDDYQQRDSERNTKEKNGLSGIEVQQIVTEKLTLQRQQWEMELLLEKQKALEDKCKEQQQEIKELEEQLESLEEEKQEELARQSPFKGLFGDVGAGIVEAVIRRNPQTIAKLIPGGEALSGLLEKDEKDRIHKLSSQTGEDQQVVFTEKTTTENTGDPAYLLVQNLRTTFSEDDFGKLLQILDAMYEEPTRLHTIHALLKGE